jgi:hypothetical protein
VCCKQPYSKWHVIQTARPSLSGLTQTTETSVSNTPLWDRSTQNYQHCADMVTSVRHYHQFNIHTNQTSLISSVHIKTKNIAHCLRAPRLKAPCSLFGNPLLTCSNMTPFCHVPCLCLNCSPMEAPIAMAMLSNVSSMLPYEAWLA